MNCPECDSPMTSGDRFCRACGHNIIFICPYCKARGVHTNDTYCHSCGKKIVIVDRPLSEKVVKYEILSEKVKKRPIKDKYAPPPKANQKIIDCLMSKLSTNSVMYEATIRNKTRFAYETVRRYLNYMVCVGDVAIEISADGKRRYRLAKSKIPVFLMSKDSLAFLLKVIEKPYSYIDALQRFRDMTPEQWMEYSEGVASHSGEICNRLNIKGKFVCKDGKISFTGGTKHV